MSDTGGRWAFFTDDELMDLLRGLEEGDLAHPRNPVAFKLWEEMNKTYGERMETDNHE